MSTEKRNTLHKNICSTIYSDDIYLLPYPAHHLRVLDLQNVEAA